MNLKSTDKYQSFLCIAIYLISLCFAGFYVGDFQRPYGEASIYLLMIGWLGVACGNFSWFANPLFFVALLVQNKRPRLSLVLGVLALLIALSFLLYGKILTDEGGGTDHITAYGFGYYLWIISMAVFVFGRIFYYVNTLHSGFTRYKSTIYLIQILIIIASAIIFVNHYFYSESSHYKIIKEREEFFSSNCSKAKNVYYEKVDNVHGIYVGKHDSVNAFGYLNSGLIEFYEVDNEKANGKPYVRYTFGNKFKGEEVNALRSEYSITTKILTNHLRKELAIGGSTVSIVNNKTNKVIATCTTFSSYARGDVSDKTCGDKNDFLIKSLNLTKRFPSSFDNQK